jgi:hypothetical protein
VGVDIRGRLLGVTFAAHEAAHADLLEGFHLAAEAAGHQLGLGAVTPSRDQRGAVQALIDGSARRWCS